MKYILLIIVALIISFGVGYIVARLILGNSAAKHKGIKYVIITSACGVVLVASAFFVYVGIHYEPDEEAIAALAGNENVTVSEIDNGYFFDGPSATSAIIFYPGAKVECTAYAPLMLKIADSGIDCFLIKMPFNLPMFGTNEADKIVALYDYDRWIIAGHSMGGVMATDYAGEHPEIIDDIVLLASYPIDEMNNDQRLCLIYGDKDGCLNKELYETNKCYRPEQSTEYVIAGGNHAQFGNYGKQKGDGAALISAWDQQNITVEYITEFVAERRR